ncbi:hypothetical protein HY636_04905 [Candidatus Woesearchaeota archaeon]|nr:hypothetical protein [Candidatus Woesearchaeota archaeon]
MSKKFRTEEEQRQAKDHLLWDVMRGVVERELCGWPVERGKREALMGQFKEIEELEHTASVWKEIDKHFGSAAVELMQRVAIEGSDICDEFSPKYSVIGDFIYLMQSTPPYFSSCWDCCGVAQSRNLWVPKLDELLKAGHRTAGLEGSIIFCMDQISVGDWKTETYRPRSDEVNWIGPLKDMDVLLRESYKVKDVLYGPIEVVKALRGQMF